MGVADGTTVTADLVTVFCAVTEVPAGSEVCRSLLGYEAVSTRK